MTFSFMDHYNAKDLSVFYNKAKTEYLFSFFDYPTNVGSPEPHQQLRH